VIGALADLAQGSGQRANTTGMAALLLISYQSLLVLLSFWVLASYGKEIVHLPAHDVLALPLIS
jgi:hypothetical protein